MYRGRCGTATAAVCSKILKKEAGWVNTALLDRRFERPARFRLMRKGKQAAGNSNGAFVTATDTGVGKTVVTAALAIALRKHGQRAGVMKPIETGLKSPTGIGSDAARLRTAAGSSDLLREIRPYAFRRPLAPLDAARLEKRCVSMPHILRTFRRLQLQHEILLVEGIGGLLTPIMPKHDVSDLIYQMKLPVIVVGRVSLGGINHAMLTLQALRRRNIPVLALVLNRSLPRRTATAQAQEQSTIRLLRHIADMPVIGPLPYRAALERNFQHEVTKLAGTAAITKLVRLVLARMIHEGSSRKRADAKRDGHSEI